MKEFVAVGVCEVEGVDEESLREHSSRAICIKRVSNKILAQRHVNIQGAPAGEFLKRVFVQRVR